MTSTPYKSAWYRNFRIKEGHPWCRRCRYWERPSSGPGWLNTSEWPSTGNSQCDHTLRMWSCRPLRSAPSPEHLPSYGTRSSPKTCVWIYEEPWWPHPPPELFDIRARRRGAICAPVRHCAIPSTISRCESTATTHETFSHGLDHFLAAGWRTLAGTSLASLTSRSDGSKSHLDTPIRRSHPITRELAGSIALWRETPDVTPRTRQGSTQWPAYSRRRRWNHWKRALPRAVTPRPLRIYTEDQDVFLSVGCQTLTGTVHICVNLTCRSSTNCCPAATRT